MGTLLLLSVHWLWTLAPLASLDRVVFVGSRASCSGTPFFRSGSFLRSVWDGLSAIVKGMSGIFITINGALIEGCCLAIGPIN